MFDYGVRPGAPARPGRPLARETKVHRAFHVHLLHSVRKDHVSLMFHSRLLTFTNDSFFCSHTPLFFLCKGFQQRPATHRFKALMMRPAAKTSTLLAYTKMFIGGNAFAELYGLTCGGMQKCSSRSDKASRPWPCRRRLRGTRAEQEETIARPRAIHHIKKLHMLYYQYTVKLKNGAS